MPRQPILPPDPFANDPFFKRGPDAEWNACIGSQGDEHNYVDGYMQAAMELVSAILEKQSWGQRDTLVLPILYNARHAIELVLKFSARRLVKAGFVQGPVRSDHKVGTLWKMLDDAKLSDRTLRNTIAALKPFVDSMTAIDQDGQELRYHQNIQDDPSLEDYYIANLEVIRDSLTVLSALVEKLQWRTVAFLSEHWTGTHTARCSRADLFEINQLLPPMSKWREQSFDDAKARVRAEFGLSSNDFSKAINVIKVHPELRGLLGAETPLKYLTDDLVVASIKEWRRWHPPRDPKEKKSANAHEIALEILSDRSTVRSEVIAAIERLLTPEQFGELAALFYLSRDRWFSESFGDQAEQSTAYYLGEENSSIGIYHLFSKTNLLKQVTRGAAQIGRLTLAETLSTL